jgi:hypothetical protein
MSDVSKGASRVGSVQSKLSRLGYRTARVSASGQRRGKRKDENGIAGDIIAFAEVHGWPHLLVEVGGEKKSVKAALVELRRGGLPPGFIPIVARCIGRRWRFHGPDEKGHDALFDAIKASLE